jgi:hypothetical protein
MRSRPLLTDLAVAVVAAIIIIVFASGWAIVALIALVLLIVCALSFGFSAVRRRLLGRPSRSRARR